ncbi:MAG: (d)CMP kinase [Elusimicrobia bacterium]|nr:(d)CMP kinase [Elusimicrobiota bacterium]
MNRSPIRLRGVIAIDGPAGVGKSTVARLVAKQCGLLFVNTGDMYRALTWRALKEGVDIKNKRAVVNFLSNRMNWDFHIHDGMLKVRVQHKDLGREIKSEKVSRATPTVAQIPQVRRRLRRLQRSFALNGGVVLEGRDTTTHVAPEAGLKIFLDASAEERAKRRFHQLLTDGKRVKLTSIQDAIRLRDYREKKKKIMPARHGPGTITLDTTHLTLHEVADRIIQLYKKSGEQQ